MNYSKAQIIVEFQAIKTLAKDLQQKKGIDLGVFVVNVGQFIRNNADSEYLGQEQLLKTAGAPLSFKGITHDYILTV